MRSIHDDAISRMPTLQVYEIVGNHEKLIPIPSKGLLTSRPPPVLESSSSDEASSASPCSGVFPREDVHQSTLQQQEHHQDKQADNSSRENKRDANGSNINETLSQDEALLLSSSLKPILKRSFSLQEIPLATRTSSWRQLPAPNLEYIRSSSCPTTTTPTTSVPAQEANSKGRRKQRRPTVTFDSIQIREYNQTVGDNPSVSIGPPICLDWDFEELEPISVNDYEDHRGLRRTMRQMMMSFHQRRKVLMWLYGFSEQQVEEATHQVNQSKRQRAMTQALLPCQMLEELLQSAQRKAKRFQERRKSTTTSSTE
jgi:hypothetical protein